MKEKQVSVKYMGNEEAKLETRILKDIAFILESNNENFIPSLYERIQTVGTLKEKTESRVQERILDNYNYFLAFIDDELVGFTELKFESRMVAGENMLVLAIGTSAVNPNMHGLGIAKELYKKVEELAVIGNAEAVTRSTWSTNYKQLKLYDKFGYKEYERELNGRGIEIDLVRFIKLFQKEQPQN